MAASRAQRAGLIAALVLTAVTASAQGARCADPVRATTEWRGPLGATVTLAATTIDLREAIDRAARAANVRISYATDVLEGRMVCITARPARLGDLLTSWLGAVVRIVPMNDELIVLAPAPRRPIGVPELRGRSDLETRAQVQLDSVIVRSAGLDAYRGRPDATDIVQVDQQRLTRGFASIAELLEGTVPGLWQVPRGDGLGTGFGAMRGASSFGAAAPKILLDGIEVANSAVLARMDPNTIERIDVSRGPAGSALFGANTTGGVIRLTSRTPSIQTKGTHFDFRSLGGYESGDLGRVAAVVQDYALGLESSIRDVGILGNVALGRADAPAPFLTRGEVSGMLGMAYQGSASRFHLNTRYHSSEVREDSVVVGRQDPIALSTYSLSTGLTRVNDERWAGGVVLGVDGFSYAPTNRPRLLASDPSDSALAAAFGASRRLQVRANLSGLFGVLGKRSARLGAAVDQSYLSSHGARKVGYVGMRDGRSSFVGVVAQADVEPVAGFFVNAGLRGERSSFWSLSGTQGALMPTLGTSWQRSFGAMSLKLRGAYGRSMRLHDGAGEVRYAVQLVDSPERQTGHEFGIDAAWKQASVKITRFSQRAFGLVQSTTTLLTFDAGGAYRVPTEVTSVRNAGAIRNEGWETAATLSLGRVDFVGTAALVDSRVAKIAADFDGDARVGDRMLNIPRFTGTLSSHWGVSRWRFSLGLKSVRDWMGYDLLAYARDFANDVVLEGDGALRRYVRRYRGRSEVDLGVTRDLSDRVSLIADADNIFAVSRAMDNATRGAGRTIRVGLRGRR